MTSAAKLRYFETSPPGGLKHLTLAPHSEFLRTGKIARPERLPSGKRYLTPEEVGERTGRILAKAGETTLQRINSFHRGIRFPKLIFYRVFDEIPHLGYCHVTTSRTSFNPQTEVKWSFYIANFTSEISETYPFFERISSERGRMYFAVAFEKAPGDTFRIDRSIRKNGLLFRTLDPQEALRNVLMLGAPNSAIRTLVKKI